MYAVMGVTGQVGGAARANSTPHFFHDLALSAHNCPNRLLVGQERARRGLSGCKRAADGVH
jgi:hypothetical protein